MVCKALFGIGITSPYGAYDKLTGMKALAGKVGVVTQITKTWPTNKEVVVVNNIGVFAKFQDAIKPSQVVVISDVVTLLSTIPELIPLDYSNVVSYSFNFKEPDYKLVALALRSKKKPITTTVNSLDQLGQVINKYKQSDPTLNVILALLSNLPFKSRGVLMHAFDTFFKNPVPKVKRLIKTVTEAVPEKSLAPEIEKFSKVFLEKGKSYHEAINSKLSSQQAAEKFALDPYALSFFKKKMQALAPVKVRLDQVPEDNRGY